MNMKRLLWGFITIAAVTLVGCGGGGGGGNNARIMELEEMLATVTGERDTAQARVTELQGLLSDANDMIDSLNMQIANAPTQAEVDALTKQRDDYMTMANNYKTMLDAANARLAEIERENEETMAAAARADRIQREMRLRAAITDDTVSGANRIPATYTAKTIPDTTGSGVTGVTVTRSVAGNVNIDVNGATNDDDYAGGSFQAGSGSWNSAMLTKTDPATETQDVLVIYTDIDAPADKLFTAQYSQAVRDTILNPTSLSLDAAGLASHLKKVMSSGFPSDPSTTWVYDGSQNGRSKTVIGTFDGVPGQFTCTAASCTLSTNASGMLIAPTTDSDWRFTPNSPNDATVKDPDTGYAWFGWWLNKPKDNKAVHDVEVFSGGSTGYAANVANALEGNATYTGPAAGKYITKTFSAGAQTDAGAGHFTANANLTAKFGAADAAGTISGSISGFVLDDTDSTTAAAWRVMLESADLSDGTATFNSTTEANFGAGATTTNIGQWQGSFYNASPDTVAADKRYPNTVVGTFDAVTDNAAVIGGFGADRQ